MTLSTSGTQTLGLHDLVEDVLILILVQCDVPGVLAVSGTSKFLRRIALTTRTVWYTLVAKLVRRGFIDSRPEDGYYRDLSAEQLIGLIQRLLHGPKMWTDTPSQSRSFSAPRSQTVTCHAVNLFRNLLRKPPLDSLASAPLVEARRIVLHRLRPESPHVALNFRTTDSLKLLPGGKYLLFQNSGRVECWSVFEDRRIWIHTPSMDHTLVHDFEVDMIENDIAIILTCQLTEPQPKCFVEITSLDLKTGASDLELVSRLPDCPFDFEYVDCAVCGDVAAVYLRPESQVLLLNWRTHSRVVLSEHNSETALVPGYLVVLTPSKPRLALSPLALLLWESNDSVTEPSSHIPFADLPLLSDTISLAVKPYHTFQRSIWIYESPLQQGHFTVWLHALVNGAPAVCSYGFVKHDTGVSWRFLSSTLMPTLIHPEAISFSGHTLGYCNGYDGQGILPPVPVGKNAARRKIVDLPCANSSIRLSPFGGALTYFNDQQLVVVYYE